MIIRLRTALAKPNTAYSYGLYVCALCFLFAKAIVPAGFMFSGEFSQSIMMLCHGDARSMMVSNGVSHAAHASTPMEQVSSNGLPFSPSEHVSSAMLCGFAALTYILALIGLVLVVLFQRAFSFDALYTRYFVYSLRYLRPTLRGPPKFHALDC